MDPSLVAIDSGKRKSRAAYIVERLEQLKGQVLFIPLNTG